MKKRISEINLKKTPTLDFNKKVKKVNLEIEIPGETILEKENHELLQENLELKRTIQQMMMECSRIESKMFIMNDQIQTLTSILNSKH